MRSCFVLELKVPEELSDADVIRTVELDPDAPVHLLRARVFDPPKPKQGQVNAYEVFMSDPTAEDYTVTVYAESEEAAGRAVIDRGLGGRIRSITAI